MVRKVVVPTAAMVSLVALSFGLPAAGQYRPVVPASNTYNYNGGGGYWGGSYGGGTVASNNMQGMASVISAKGNYNLSTSAAAVNMTEADRNSIQNQQLATETYFKMRSINRAATAAERSPPLSMEQLVRIAANGVPKPLSSDQMNPVTGQVMWPDVLLDDRYTPGRTEVNSLVNKRATYGRLAYSDQKLARTTIDGLSGQLKEQISDIPAQPYMDSRNFLRSLMYSLAHTDLD